MLGDRLRAVVLCDFETAGRDARAATDGVLDPGAGSAAGALRTLLADPVAAAPAARSSSAGGPWPARGRRRVDLVALARADPELAAGASPGYDALAAGRGRGRRRLGRHRARSTPAHPAWTSRRWVPLVTAFFEAGGSRCLVGTRAMLGEGWNSQRANVLVDLGAATTSVSVQQVRGRTLRLDPDDPGRSPTTGTSCACAEGHVRGDADYARFVRKHRSLLRPRARRARSSPASRTSIRRSRRSGRRRPRRSRRSRRRCWRGPARRAGVAGRLADRRAVPGRAGRDGAGPPGRGRPGCRAGGSCRADPATGTTAARARGGIAAGGAAVATGALAAGAVLGRAARRAGGRRRPRRGSGGGLAPRRAGRLARLAPARHAGGHGPGRSPTPWPPAASSRRASVPDAVRVAAPARRLLPLLPRRRATTEDAGASPRRSRSWSRRSGIRAGSSRGASSSHPTACGHARRRRPVARSRAAAARPRCGMPSRRRWPAARTASRRSRRPGRAGSARAPARSPRATPARRPCWRSGPATTRSAWRPSSGRSGPDRRRLRSRPELLRAAGGPRSRTGSSTPRRSRRGCRRSGAGSRARPWAPASPRCPRPSRPAGPPSAWRPGCARRPRGTGARPRRGRRG